MALALGTLVPAEADAQFTVWKDGVAIFSIDEGIPDFFTFEYYPAGATYDATPDESVGGSVPDAADAVDLGLPSGTLWAPWNIGATKASEAGAYFAWGEIKAKDSYSWANYEYSENGTGEADDITKYNKKDGKARLDAGDAALRNWGAKWIIPTFAQLCELFEECTWEWKEEGWDGDGSLAGYLLTSKTNQKTLFMPAAGMRGSETESQLGVKGCYWSSNLFGVQDCVRALSCEFENDPEYEVGDEYASGGNRFRFRGLTIRPVRSSQK